MNYPFYVRMTGVALAIYLLVHTFGAPYGLLWGAALAMIVLP